ncbi:MAG: IMP cyclohydrolase [Oscillospiraceae bacterium]|nr:IMP cyclohydrolase [Oscillospiraceae bacterium]
MNSLFTLLQGNPYPGRGIVLGAAPDGIRAVLAYFIMGRSENSRNRVFAPHEAGIRTQAYDESRMTDPSLILYAPVRTVGVRTVVTNGDQTDTICDYLAQGKSFAEALAIRTFEPDAPNYTPRISGLLEADGRYTLSILKSADGNPAACRRFFYAYDPLPGQGHFIHTYQGDGDPLPSFAGEPFTVEMEDNTGAFAKKLWTSLDVDNKVSLFVRYITLETGETETLIFNRHEEAE